MEIDNSLASSLNELVMLQKQQLQKINDLTTQQAEQTNLQRQQNLKYTPQNVSFQGSSAQSQQFMPAMFNPAGGMNAQARQFQSYSQSLSGKGANYGFVDTFFPQNNAVSYETRSLLGQDYAGRFTNAFISGSGAVASTGVSLATMAGAGLIEGMVAGTAGGALVGAYFNNAGEQAKVQNAYTKYLQRESYRFINPQESNNNRGYAGFSLNESQQMASFLRTVNSEFQISDKGMMSLLTNYTESGLLRDTSDMETFKRKIKDLTKSVKSGAMMLNETYESIADLMADMKKTGISEGNYTGIMSMGKIIGSDLGISGSEATRMIVGTASGMTQGTGLSNDVYVGRISDTLTYANAMYENLKNNNNLNAKDAAAKNYINNNGGVQGVSSIINQIQDSLLAQYKDVAAGFYDYDKSSGTWSFNNDRFSDIMSKAQSGEYNLNDLYTLGTSNLTKYGDYAIKDWQDNYSLYLGNQLTESQISSFSKSLSMAQNQLIPGANINDLDSGLSFLMNLSPDQRALYSNYLSTVSSQGSQLMMKQYDMAAFQNISADMKANTPTIIGGIKGGWEDFKEAMGSWGADISDFFGQKAQDLTDLYYGGKGYTDLNFQTNTNWSEQGLKDYRADFFNTLQETKETLQSFKNQGFDVSDDLIGSFNIKNPDRKTYEYAREIITNPEKLTGIVGENYQAISQVAEKEDLSETILSALVKFSGRSEGQKFFGASQSTVEEIAKNNSLNISSPENATLEQKLQLAAEQISKLVGLYGGNEDLTMKAFYGGQQSVDDQLREMGYDVDKLRSTGDQGTLSGIDTSGIKTNSSYVTYRNYENSDSYDPTDIGVKFNVNGKTVNLTPESSNAYYSKDYDYKRKSKTSRNNDEYYDLVHLISGQLGISPNALGTLMQAESGGRPDADGGSGDVGLTQVVASAQRWKTYKGTKIARADGSYYEIGSDEATQRIEADYGGEAAMSYELINHPESALYIGGSIWRDSLKNATTDGTENPYLAYAMYNGGGGYNNFLEWAAGEKGINYNTMTAKQIRDISYEYAWGAGEFFRHSSNPAGYVKMKGDANLNNWSKQYSKGVIDPDPKDIDVEYYDTKIKTESKKVMKDAIDNALISPEDISMLTNGKSGKSPLDIASIQSINNAYNDAINKTKMDYNTASGNTLDPNTGLSSNGFNSIGRFFDKMFMGNYEKQVLDANFNRSSDEYRNDIILSKDMMSEVLYGFAPKGVGKGDFASSEDAKAKAASDASTWYKNMEDEIKKSINKESNTWDDLTVEAKTKALQTMKILSSSSLKEEYGLNLGNITNLVGEDMSKAFSQKELESMFKIDSSGHYTDKVQAKDTSDAIKNTMRWIANKTPIDFSSSVFGQTELVGIMGVTTEQAIKDLEAQKDTLTKQIATGKATTGSNAKLDTLMNQIKTFQELNPAMNDLAQLGDATATFFDLSKSEKKKLRDDMRYQTLDDDGKELNKMTNAQKIDTYTEGREVLMNEIKSQLEKDFEGFSKQWAKYIQPETTSEYMEKYFNVDQSGKVSLKEGVKVTDEMVTNILNLFTQFNDEAEKIKDTTGDTNKSASDLTEAGDVLSKAVTDFSGEAKLSAATLGSTIETINTRVNDLAQIVTGLKLGSGSPLIKY
jgi:hypothetical protein